MVLHVACDSKGISQVVKIIKKGGIVVFPTDTVYGIGGDPFNKNSVKSIFKIKNREPSKPLPILAHSIDEISKIAEFDESSKKIAEKFWPGPITIILKLTSDKLKKSMGLSDKVAVRVPNNQCLLSVLKECKMIVGTSANISGKKEVVSPDELTKDLTGYDIILDGGKIAESAASTIVENKDGKILIHRQGRISLEEINEIL